VKASFRGMGRLCTHPLQANQVWVDEDRYLLHVCGACGASQRDLVTGQLTPRQVAMAERGWARAMAPEGQAKA
jgi:hypothetical protein